MVTGNYSGTNKRSGMKVISRMVIFRVRVSNTMEERKWLDMQMMMIRLIKLLFGYKRIIG
jgi:hypothetical protein